MHAPVQHEIPMKLSPLTFLTCAFSLAMLAMAQVAFASDNQQAFTYDIELQVPLAQRKLLEDHLDLYRWRGRERMNEAQLQRLAGLAPDQIRKFLATEGFYSPAIKVEMEHKGSRWVVHLVVDPGNPVRVTRFDLQVTGPFNDDSAASRARLEKMRTDWSMRPDAVFRHADWESAKRNALKALLIDGYPTASIADSHATVNQESSSVELRITLESGPFFTFGALKIEGLQRYPATLVERMSPIVAGDPYSQSKLLALQSRLQDSPYFANVSVNAEIDPKQPTGVPVRAKVVEYPSRKLGFGIGMSTDTGARGLVDYRDLNFLDRAWQLGGALKLEKQRQSLGSDLQLPLTEQKYNDSITTLLEHTDIEGQETQKLVLGAKRTFIREKTDTAYGLRYFLEKQYIAGAASARSAALSPTYSWTFRDVDHVLYPTSGYVINFQADTATRAILSDQDFFRGYSRAVYFYPLGKSDQLTLRGELGVVAASSRQGIPSDFLFRTGGDQTVRGYAYQSLGVHEGSAVVGGRYLALASAEYVHWLTPRWGAGIFVDGGNAVDDWDLLSPVYGYGLGARWKSPVGPLNLDLAYGEAVRQMRIHFSVGFNF
jgi:translocation and assembly module TamA